MNEHETNLRCLADETRESADEVEGDLPARAFRLADALRLDNAAAHIVTLERQLAEAIASENTVPQEIADDAERAGVCTDGLSGLAIVHTMVEHIAVADKDRDALRAKLGEVEGDAARLSWLEAKMREDSSGRNYLGWNYDWRDTLREAIDIAMREEQDRRLAMIVPEEPQADE